MRALAVLALLATGGIASGDVIVDVVPVDNSSQLTGWVTQDLVVTTDTDWVGSALVVTLDEDGDIYQDDLGRFDPQSPNPVFFGAVPSLEFDTYVSNGVLGEAVIYLSDMPPYPDNYVFDRNAIWIQWSTGDLDDIGELAVARVTLADDATGTWSFTVIVGLPGDPDVTITGGSVADGVMIIPEPTTLSLLGLGGLLLGRGRRRKC